MGEAVITSVIGMHRSGTSLLASMLAMCGIYPGPEEKQLQGEVKSDNPYGYWEYDPFVHINDELLTLLGGTWDSPPPIFQSWTTVYDLAPFKQRAQQQLEEDYAGQDAILWKDPRTCLTVEFWKNVFPELKPVIIVRHPLEVAFSMASGKARARDLPVAQALSLWKSYHKTLLQTINPDDAIWVHYDNLMKQPETELGRILDYLGLSVSSEKRQAAIDRIHYDQRKNDLSTTQLPDDIESAYRQYCEFAKYTLPAETNTHDDLLHIIVSGDHRFQNLLDRHRKQVNTLEAQRDAYSQEVTQREARLAQLNAQLEQNQQEIAQLNIQLEQRWNEITQRDAQIEQERQEITQLNIHIEQERQSVKQLQAQLEDKQKTIAQINEQITRLNMQLQQGQQNQQQLQSQLEQQQQALAGQAEALTHSNAQLSQYQQQHEIQHRELQGLRQSISAVETLVLQGFNYRWLRASRLFGWAHKVINRWRIRRITRLFEENKMWVPSLFNADWYTETYTDVKTSDMPAYVHFYLFGWYQGYRPMPIFDVRWYATHYPEFNSNGMNPLEHYEHVGRDRGNRPCEFFDPHWYAQTYEDIRIEGVEPLLHYCYTGWREHRNPSPEFDTDAYLEKHPELLRLGKNPLDHYLSQGRPTGDQPAKSTFPSPIITQQSENLLPDTHSVRIIQKEFETNYRKSAELETYQSNHPQYIDNPAVKLIAFYLPQYHPTPENDAFWGKGFTEWTNITRARPLFEGHYQPRLPGDLGFYDLRLVENLEEQARLAKEHGIMGFCIYRYWFNGKTVLDQPLELLRAHTEIDINYCLCWANENWTRRWDGLNEDVLLAQNHSPEDDLAFIQDAARFFDDPRYIRVNDKPLLIIYNTSKLPDPVATTNRWREYCRAQGYGGLYLVVVMTFGFEKHPVKIGFDAAVQMPPHKHKATDIADRYHLLVDDFDGLIFDYDDFASFYKSAQPVDYTRFLTVSPAWDNTARRGKRGTVIVNADAKKYGQWLHTSIQQTIDERDPDERLVFINAWNEWAEGTYLEPDRKYGYTTLNITSQTLAAFSGTDIVLLGPNAARAGSQIVLLGLVEWLAKYTQLNIKLILDEGGALLNDYRHQLPTFVISDLTAAGRTDTQITEAIRSFCGPTVNLIYANTCMMADLVERLPYDTPVISHIHELETSIKKYCNASMPRLRNMTDHFIAVSLPVEDLLHRHYSVNYDDISMVNPFIVTNRKSRPQTKQAIVGDESIRIIWGCGTVNKRKGFDIFIETALRLKDSGVENFQFCWIGGPSEDFPNVEGYIQQKNAQDIVHYLGVQTDTRAYFAVGDLFFLASREDPHPLVMLEAAEQGLPIFCFADTGGAPAFVAEDAGVVVNQMTPEAMAEAIATLLHDDNRRKVLGQSARHKVLQRYSRRRLAPHLLQVMRHIGGLRPKVSVIVPAYNHATYIRKRLDSIYGQTFQDFEVILLDDASPDGTADILREYAAQYANTTLLLNEENTGSTFSQWMRGIEHAQADLIWIAEDDDYCEPGFLEKLLPYFNNPEVKLTYCQSYAVDENNDLTMNYKQWTDDLSTERWSSSYVAPAQYEVNTALAKKNTIPNASAVIFRKFDAQQWAADWVGKRLAGDWAFYLYAMKGGKVAFCPEALNYHRRHENTNIHRYQFDERRFIESARVQRTILDLYMVEPAVKALMRQGSLENWREVYPNRSEAEFEAVYNAILRGEIDAIGQLT